tara:strand:- start:394 stop:702 length:309 start_codon:yes stop_codon:yes gene_type:complete
MSEKFKYKYTEDKTLDYISSYIESTYQQHYVGQLGIQAIDVWKSLDIDEESFRSNIIKYAMRYKYKEGSNLKDLIKIIHYTILLIDKNHAEEVQRLLDSSPR